MSETPPPPPPPAAPVPQQPLSPSDERLYATLGWLLVTIRPRVRTFRAHDRRSLAEALAGAADLGSGEARLAARASVAANDPDLISERFATAVRGALVVTAAGAAGHG